MFPPAVCIMGVTETAPLQGVPHFVHALERGPCSITFLLDYTYVGQSPDVKQQTVEMAMHARGIRDTARVLHVSTNTVMKERKQRRLRCPRCITRCWRTGILRRERGRCVALRSWHGVAG